MKRAGRELGVRYLLEGSVRRSGDRVRVNAQLIDAQADRHVWAQRYDRKIDDLFELQDDIVASIASTVGPEITLAEIERARGKRPEALDAWDLFLRAKAGYHRMTKQDVEAGIADLEKAIAIEPEFPAAVALLGLCHAHIGMRGWVRPARPAFEKARAYAERSSSSMADRALRANQSLALVQVVTGRSAEAVRVAQRAIELNQTMPKHTLCSVML